MIDIGEPSFTVKKGWGHPGVVTNSSAFLQSFLTLNSWRNALIRLKFLGVATAAMTFVATATATATLAQVSTAPSSAVEATHVQASCVNMMQGWEATNAVDLPANIRNVTFRNTTRNRMVAITKKSDGQYWIVADLLPGERVTRARMSSNTKVAWALHGGRHHCLRSFTLENEQQRTI